MTQFSIFFIIMTSFLSYPVISFFLSELGRDWSKRKRRLLKFTLSVLCGCLCSSIRLLMLALLHFLVFLLLTKGIYTCLRRLCPNYSNSLLLKLYKSGLIPLAATVILISFGFFNIHTVHQTVYKISSDKLDQNYRIVFLSDIHYNTVQNVKILDNKIEEINKLSPDIVILGGDMLDETDTREDMLACFASLGKLQSKYGCYFVYGNHDRQRYSANPAYTEQELMETIEMNGITILQDEFVTIENDLLLLGREDLGAKYERSSIDILKEGIDAQRFLLTADHQPFGVSENVLLSTDLQLSGHTHTGQIFPLAYFDFFFKGYVYGKYQEEQTTLLVSSGFAGWGFPVRTQGISEYLLIELIADHSSPKTSS